MCGRYVITNPINKTIKIVKKSINVNNTDNYNAHPQQNLPVIKRYLNGNTLEIHKWVLFHHGQKKKNLDH